MINYKYDTHIHTAEVSPCAKIDAASAVRLYKSVGYTGIVITDHYFRGYFDSISGSWEFKTNAFLEGYRNALTEGEKSGLKVVLGIELCFDENNNDYLVFGINEAFLKENKRLYELSLKEFRKLTENTSILIYQAHPFRMWASPADPDYLDGIEVHNGSPRYHSNNRRALDFAQENNLKMLSGSDFHQKADLATGGILLPETPENSHELAALLRADRVTGLVTGK